MYEKVHLDGQLVSLSALKEIGGGGEAIVYELNRNQAIKIYRSPDDSFFSGPNETANRGKEGAKRRLKQYQQKLLEIPRNLPTQVITPEKLVYDESHNLIVGYTMKCLRDAEPLRQFAQQDFRLKGVSNNDTIKMLTRVHWLQKDIHQKGVVIGDNNDLNTLIANGEPNLIDADSLQFGRWLCEGFTLRFVDPTLCDPKPKGDRLILIKPHNENSDWYAFTVMVMECLLFVDPYGGTYINRGFRGRVSDSSRPLARITVFNPNVRYPKNATPFKVLPDDLLGHFVNTFEKDKRGEFPVRLLEGLRWTKCRRCGAEHARNSCPSCAFAAPSAIKESTVIRGKLSVSRIFNTPGQIVFASEQNGRLAFLHYEGNTFRREDGTKVTSMPLNSWMRFRLFDKSTLIARGSQLEIFTTGGRSKRLSVDTFGNLPVFDANAQNYFWLQNGKLYRDDNFGPEYVGDVLTDQTLFWVGSTFGCGFYQAGQLTTGFVFDAKRAGINESVQLPSIKGHLVDSTAVFSREKSWLFTTTQEAGKLLNRCFQISRSGHLEAQAEEISGKNSWLGTIRGKSATGNFLFAGTDDGLVRIEASGNSLSVSKKFADTEPYVDSASFVFVIADGVAVINKTRREIVTLRM